MASHMKNTCSDGVVAVSAAAATISAPTQIILFALFSGRWVCCIQCLKFLGRQHQ
jgi:hypothetical protein